MWYNNRGRSVSSPSHSIARRLHLLEYCWVLSAAASRMIIWALTLLMAASPAWAYRPFVSTDAAVASLNELEVEAGYFTFARTNGNNTFVVPDLVLNYGFMKNVELVGQFGVEEDSRLQLIHPGLFLKSVLHEGVLQDKSGFSFAIEAGP